MTLALLFPGQGSQSAGMGAGLFEAYPELVATADEILGYPIRQLCLEGGPRLRRTEYVQPAMFVVNALTYRSRADGAARPAYLAGHSLGEYNALVAAGCLDFATALRLVRRRGELMGGCPGGGMLAVLGLDRDRVTALIAEAGLDGIDVANHNTLQQLVLAGPPEQTRALTDLIAERRLGKTVPLNVSVAAHSRYMAPAARAYADLLRTVEFAEPTIPVLANVTAEPHTRRTTVDTLVRHLTEPVRWWDTLQTLARAGVDDIEEVGPGDVLSKMWARARPDLPAPTQPQPEPEPATPAPPDVRPDVRPAGDRRATGPAGGTAAVTLGGEGVRAGYGIRYAYLAGALGHGVSGPDMLLRLAGAGLFGFLGTTGRTLAEVDADLRVLTATLGTGGWGVNLPAGVADADWTNQLVDLALRHGARYADAPGLAGPTAELVRWRYTGARTTADGDCRVPRRLLVKAGRADRAEAFLRPAPDALIDRLRATGALTDEEAACAARVPVASEVCAEADSGWLAGGVSSATLLPSILASRDAASARHGHHVHIGASGGLGTPEAVAAAFLIGAEFVLTGSINQCTPQARTSDAARTLLATLGPDDTTLVPGAEPLALGGQSRVVRRGTLFPTRAAARWRRRQLGAGAVGSAGDDDRAYHAATIRAAVTGDERHRLEYQIPCGPAMGAFNRYATRAGLSDWRDRHVELLAESLMTGAADLLGAVSRPPVSEAAR